MSLKIDKRIRFPIKLIVMPGRLRHIKTVIIHKIESVKSST